MKQKEKEIWIYELAKVLLYALIIAVDFFCTYTDMKHIKGEYYGENTFVEWWQEIQMAACIVLFFITGKKNNSERSLCYTLAAIMLMGLIREFNNFFKDEVFQGAWSILVGSIGLAALWYIYKHYAFIIDAAYRFLQRPAYGLLLAGFLIVFVFSRIFGLPDMWRIILGAAYNSLPERVAEEGTEVLGYSFMLLGTIDYAVQVSKFKKLSAVNA